MKRLLPIAVMLLALAAAACSASVGVDPQPHAEGYDWVISDGRTVDLRDCAGWNCNVISRLEPGTLVMVLERGNEWTRIRSRQTGNEGWVPAERVWSRY